MVQFKNIWITYHTNDMKSIGRKLCPVHLDKPIFNHCYHYLVLGSEQECKGTLHLILQNVWCAHEHVSHWKDGHTWRFMIWIESVHVDNEEYHLTIHPEQGWSIWSWEINHIITHLQVNVRDCVLLTQAWAYFPRALLIT